MAAAVRKKLVATTWKYVYVSCLQLSNFVHSSNRKERSRIFKNSDTTASTQEDNGYHNFTRGNCKPGMTQRLITSGPPGYNRR
jgi:hypothetical protein